jgi:hypothetical protein
MLSHHVARVSWKRRTASGAMTWALSMDGIIVHALRIVGIAELENPLSVRLPYLAAFPQANPWLLPGLIHKSRRRLRQQAHERRGIELGMVVSFYASRVSE